MNFYPKEQRPGRMVPGVLNGEGRGSKKEPNSVSLTLSLTPQGNNKAMFSLISCL
jgi:hypothetical protein